MITKEEARKRVEKRISNLYNKQDDKLIIIDEATIERDWGWVFFYDSKKRVETGDFRYAVLGNAPFIVEKETGKLIPTGTAKSIDDYIEEYEKSRNVHD